MAAFMLDSAPPIASVPAMPASPMQHARSALRPVDRTQAIIPPMAAR